jgi:hypothetical protein
LCTAWIDDKFSVDLPTLASEINVSNGISDKAKQLMLLNLLMHLALHHRHETLIESLPELHGNQGKSGRKTRSTKRIVLRYHLVASLLKKPPGNVLLQQIFHDNLP